jgi:hypothetical protein
VLSNARLYAVVSQAMDDALISVMDAKYHYNFWRPITAVQRADQDSNPDTVPDPGWESFLVTPPFPEYVSGHSAFSMASAVVLARFFGTDELAFSVGSDTLPAVTRRFSRLSDCAQEISLSRVYGGIHFLSACEDGKRCGSEIGAFVSSNFLLPNSELPRMRWESSGSGEPGLRLHGQIGRRYVVETSADLEAWQPFRTNAALIGGVTMTIPRLQSVQFFRVREE